MHTSLALARAQLRHGWRNLVGLTLLIALVGGLVLGGAAGAVRTSTAVDRMIDATDAADVLVNPDEGDDTELDFDAVAALPMVQEFSRGHGMPLPVVDGPLRSVEDLFSGPSTFGTDGRVPFEFNRPVLVRGRMPDPQSLDEIYLDRTFAQRAGIDVGDVIHSQIPTADDLADVMQAEDGGLEAVSAVVAAPGFGTPTDLEVVGIGNGLDGVVVDEGFEPQGAWVTPALYRSLGEPSIGYGGAVVRLTSDDQIDEFRAAVEALAPNEKIVFQTRAVMRDKALRGTQPAAIALAIFAVVTALLGLLIVGQAISRRAQLDARENLTLGAIGTTRRDRSVTFLLRIGVAAVFGALGAVVIAAATSWLTPVGPARFAEPNRGWDVNVSILFGGGLFVLVAVVVLAALPAWRNARITGEASVGALPITAWLATTGFPVHAATGVRFGLQPGAGTSAVPTRATNIGAVTAVAVAATTIVFATSLDHMVDDGRFYGTNFDVAFEWEGEILTTQDDVDRFVSAVSADIDVESVGVLRVSELQVEGRPVTAVAVDADGDPSISPSIAVGRAPESPDEIALGANTMDRLGVGIGDSVSLAASAYDGPAVVVGRVVLPGIGLYEGSDRTSIGEGALVVPDALVGFDESSDGVHPVARFVPSADVSGFSARLVGLLAASGGALADATEYSIWAVEPPRPSEIDSLSRLRSLPVVLSSMLVLVVGVTVMNAMVVAVRRRRRDLAVMQTLGSRNRDVITVGAWQGMTIGFVGVLLGVPLGVVMGRWLWTKLATELGTLAEPVVPVGVMALLVVTVGLLAAVAGVVPVRLGLRRSPADVLRSE